MKQYVEIDESNLRYYDVIDFEDGATFHTSLNNAKITISGNFRKQYKLIPKEDVEHILKDGTIMQRLEMLGSILREDATLTINHNGISREFFKGIIHIDNFEHILKDGTIMQRLEMLESILREYATLTINHNGISREFFKGIIHIDNFEYNLKIKADDLINVPIVDSINTCFNFKKKDYMFDARAMFMNQKMEISLYGCMAYSDGSLTFDHYIINL